MAEKRQKNEDNPIKATPSRRDTPFLRRDVVPAVRNRLVDAGIFSVHNGTPEPTVSDATFIARALSPDSHLLEKFASGLSPERQREVLKIHFETAIARREWKAKYQQAREEQALTEEDVRNPQWATMAAAHPTEFIYAEEEKKQLEEKIRQLEKMGLSFTTDTTDEGHTKIEVHGHRVMLAFYKSMCPYKCTYCTLPGANDAVRGYTKNGGEVTPEIQFEAYKKALEITKSDELHPPTVEVLNDGSWYSTKEIDPRTRELLVDDIAKREYVQTLAIESRPEYIKTDLIEEDLRRLRPDQKLKIYVGLETTDDFVATIVKKWYGWAEFEQAVDQIAQLPEDQRERVSVVAYNIMKQWCTNEREALEESARLVERIAELSKKTGVGLEVKHEPTIVSKGTDQHFFFHQIDENGERMYKNMSYFTVAELVARLAQKGHEHLVAFGQRDDIDEIETISMVSKPNNPLAYSPLDFIVYDSVQQFQVDGDFERFRRTITPAIFKNGQFTEEFLIWEKDVYGNEESALRKIIDPEGAKESKRAKYNTKISDAIQEVEHNQEILERAKNRDEKGLHLAIEKFFKDRETELEVEVELIANLEFVDFTADDVLHGTPTKHTSPAGYQVEIILMHEKSPSNVWIFIPAE